MYNFIIIVILSFFYRLFSIFLIWIFVRKFFYKLFFTNGQYYYILVRLYLENILVYQFKQLKAKIY